MEPVIFRRVAVAIFLVLVLILAMVSVPRWRLQAGVARQFAVESTQSTQTAADLPEVTVYYQNRTLPYLGMISSKAKDLRVRIQSSHQAENPTPAVELGLSHAKVKNSRIVSAELADASVVLDEKTMKLLAMKAARTYVDRMGAQNQTILRTWRDYLSFTKLREAVEQWLQQRGSEVSGVDFNEATQSITITMKNGVYWTMTPRVENGEIVYERSGGSNWFARMMRQTLDEGMSEEIAGTLEDATHGGLEDPYFDGFEVTEESLSLHFHKDAVEFTGGPVFSLVN
ncbi:MAG: hypothetical protein Q3972_06405 [Corynebacterium sp.]|nr:hypothetical protein [Corynebacterium sp.]